MSKMARRLDADLELQDQERRGSRFGLGPSISAEMEGKRKAVQMLLSCIEGYGIALAFAAFRQNSGLAAAGSEGVGRVKLLSVLRAPWAIPSPHTIDDTLFRHDLGDRAHLQRDHVQRAQTLSEALLGSDSSAQRCSPV